MDKALSIINTALNGIASIFNLATGSARIIIGVIFCVTLYMLPTGICLLRNRKDTVAIGTLNFFLGWSVIGWVVALVWSLKSQD